MRSLDTFTTRWRSTNLWLKGTVFGLLVGLVGVLASLPPLSVAIEERLGLAYLFQRRGSLPPPEEVVVVSIDRQSSRALGLPPQPEKWPRRLHASVVDELKRQGAAVIAFDMLFDEPRAPSDDARFAAAMARAGNVVLCEYLDRERLVTKDPDQTAFATVERLVRPIPQLAEAAVGLGPFPLPKVPVRVSQYWTFKTGAGDLPTLPVLTYHLFAREAFADLGDLNGEAPRTGGVAGGQGAMALDAGGRERIEGRIKELRRRWSTAPARIRPHGLQRLLRAGRAAVAAGGDARQRDTLLDLYQGPDSRHLNFYGPPGTLRTLSYHTVLAAALESLPARDLGIAGKAVFIGQSENLRLEQVDGFYTVYSSDDGLDLSGVEIAASAFANLIEGNTPWTLGYPWQHLLILAWGTLVGLAGFRFSPLWALTASFVVTALYVAGAEALFARAALWLPLVVPVLVQLPLAFVGGMLLRLRRVHRERDQIRTSFGYYLPPTVAEQLATDLTRRPAGNEVVHGTCLFTDAERYTALSERLTPDALIELMNRYCEAVFAPIQHYRGMISDIKGDSILSIWATRDPDHRMRRRSCAAALGIQRAVARFNQAHHPNILPTRIGLHTGLISLCSVGAHNRFEFSAVGDIVNTASRIENLNKYLRTRVLVSADVLAGIEALFLTREMGDFIFAGKRLPVAIHELIATRDTATGQQQALCDAFAAGLKHFRQGRWQAAHQRFSNALDHRPEDGPCQVFRELCERYQQHPPDNWDGVMRVPKN